MNDIIDKYNLSVIKNIDKENMIKIISFLEKEDCYYIDDIIEDYLDLFTINIEKFILIYNILNKKYDNSFLEYAAFDMNLFEKFYNYL